MGQLARLIFGLSEREVLLSHRGFIGKNSQEFQEDRWRLEAVGRAFLSGYHAALDEGRDERSLLERLQSLRPSLRGFAYEGAAMGLTILGALRRPWHGGRWVRSFVDGPAAPYTYLAHVGAGWALARLPRLLHRGVYSALDPLLGWLAFDGWGFHQAYFAPEATVRRGERPSSLPNARSSAYPRRAFDQGVGRALWFVAAARPAAVVEAIDSLSEAGASDRGGDLWSGVGLACAYAGGASDDELAWLVARSGEHHAAMAQGVAFAAKARLAADGTTRWLDAATRVVCGVDAVTAADLTDEALVDLAIEDRFDPALEEPAFERWRLRIQQSLQPSLRPGLQRSRSVSSPPLVAPSSSANAA